MLGLQISIDFKYSLLPLDYFFSERKNNAVENLLL